MAENENLTPKAEKKAEKASAKPKKPGFFASAKKWCKDMMAELKKVTWPTWKQTLNNTLIVLGFCVVVGLCIFVFDKLAGGVLAALLNLFHPAA